jgi:hypothetical protein
MSIIQTLAADTISLILRYASIPTLDFESHDNRTTGVERVRPDLYYLGRVCRRWYDISRCTPSTWQNITIFIDAPHTRETLSISPLNTYLTRSAPLNVRVYLLRKLRIPPSLDLNERQSVEVLLNVLAEHFERIEVLVVETNQASSLPDFESLLSSAAVHRLRRVKSVVLRCNGDDSIIQPQTVRSLPSIDGRFVLNRTLTTISIDGKNMLAMLRSSNYRSESGVEDVFASMPMLEMISINNLTFRVDGYSDELVQSFFHDILPSLQRLATLTLDTFEPLDDGHSWVVKGDDFDPVHWLLPPRRSAQPGIPFVPTSLNHVIIKHTKQDSIEFILKQITHPRTLTLIHCYFTSPSPIHVPHCSKLVLVDIPTDYHRVIPKMIACWDGQHLELVNCPCVDDVLFTELSKEMLTHPTRRPWAHLTSLKIIHCPNFLAEHHVLLASFLEGRSRLLAAASSPSHFRPAGQLELVVMSLGTSPAHD